MYAMTYVVITLAALIFLNVYCTRVGENLIYRNKEHSLLEKGGLARDELAQLNTLNTTDIANVLGQLESLTVSRLLITDIGTEALYDSAGEAVGQHILLPEVLDALGGQNRFSGSYREGVIFCRAAVPIFKGGQVTGCVYMAETDNSRGAMIHSLRLHLFQISCILELCVILFSLSYSLRFSRKIERIMNSMRIIQSGDYSHKVVTSGKDELALLGREINDLTDKLQASEEKRARFVSDASHEMKTPLASIKLLSDSILQNDMDKDTVLEFVADIGSEAQRLNRLTEKLLTLSRMDTQPGGELEIIPIAPTIERVSRMLRPSAKAAGVTIQLKLQAPCPILMEEDGLYQIIFNLMENGIKYNVPGGNLNVTLSQEDDNAIVLVEDTGLGISKEACCHIFDRFYRVDKSRSRATGGSGLGLSIVHALVENNGGSIQVESQINRGTRFTVTFPLFDTEAVP